MEIEQQHSGRHVTLIVRPLFGVFMFMLPHPRSHLGLHDFHHYYDIMPLFAHIQEPHGSWLSKLKQYILLCILHGKEEDHYSLENFVRKPSFIMLTLLFSLHIKQLSETPCSEPLGNWTFVNEDDIIIMT